MDPLLFTEEFIKHNYNECEQLFLFYKKVLPKVITKMEEEKSKTEKTDIKIRSVAKYHFIQLLLEDMSIDRILDKDEWVKVDCLVRIKCFSGTYCVCEDYTGIYCKCKEWFRFRGTTIILCKKCLDYNILDPCRTQNSVYYKVCDIVYPS